MPETPPPFGDPTTTQFWEAAQRRQLVVQRCRACGEHQFYPRPFCLACDATTLEFVSASGQATVYAMTTVHLKVHSDLDPPYVVAVVELAEGPRLVTRIVGDAVAIGDAVRVAWMERTNAPPLPVFEREETSI